MAGDYAKQAGNIIVEVTGLRPGGKMFEELSYGENLMGTLHPRILTVVEEAISGEQPQQAINQGKR